jgi:hypothetical protein
MHKLSFYVEDCTMFQKTWVIKMAPSENEKNSKR